MPTYTYPTSAALRLVEQNLIAAQSMDDPIFDLFPIDTMDDSLLLWEQKDNYIGLQQVRGLNGDPVRVNKVGLKRYMMEPGVYGEFIRLDERELTRLRQPGTFGTPATLDRMVADAQEQLNARYMSRIKQILWTLATTGTFSVIGPSNAVLHTDTFSLQTYSAGVAWSTVATATPLADLRAVQLLSRGYSVNFGGQAKMYVNRTTANRLFSNTNSADFYGKRTAGLAAPIGLAQTNMVLAEEDLPQIVIHDGGYYDDSGTFQLFIPTGKAIVAGVRPANAPVGNYMMTRNVNNPNFEPGPYVKIVDNGEDTVPRTIEVHSGHNGGPVIWYPSAIVVMSV